MSIYPEKIIKDVLKKLDVKTVLKMIDYRTDTIQEIGDTIKCFCPIHKEQVFRTLIINPKDKTFRCSYSLCPGNKGGDLLNLYSLAKGLDYDQGVTQLVKEMKIDIELPTTQEFIDKTVEVAENYLELGALEEAEKGFSKVSQIQPSNIDSHKGLLEIATLQKDEDKIREELKHVVGLLLGARQYEDALTYCNQLVEKMPESKEAHTWMVESYLGQEDYQSALGEYMTLADLYEGDSDFEMALEVYRKIENLGLDIIDVYPHIINVLVASNRTEEAIEETIKRAENFKNIKEYDKTLDCYKYILELDASRNEIRKMYIDLALEIGFTEERIEECLRIIDEILEQHALGEAVEALHSLLSAVPNNPRILEKLIEVYLEQGKEGEAETLQLRLSDLHDGSGYLDEALLPLENILERKPDSVEALSRMAVLYQKKEEIDQAIDSYKKIIGIQKKEEALQDAVGTYDHLISLVPENVEFKEEQIGLLIEADKKDDAFEKTMELIDYLEAKKNHDLLIEKIRFALTLKADADVLIIRLADLFAGLKRVNEAQEEYFHAYEVLRENKKLDQAASQLLRCLDFNPDDEKILLCLADLYMEIGDTRKALNHYKKLAGILLEKDTLEEAEKVLQKIIAIQPDDINTITQLVEIYQKLGYENEVVESYEKLNRLYMEKEAFNKVIEICQEILTLRPDNIPAHEKLIQVYDRTNRKKESIELWFKLADIYDRNENLNKEEECYEAILKIDNGNIDARRRHIFLLIKLSRNQVAHKEARILSDQYILRKQPEQAIDLYNELLKTDPEDPPLNLHLLELYKKTGDTPQIISQIQRLIELYKKREQLETVAEYQEELIKYDPENIDFRTSLVDTLLALEEKERAISQLIDLAELHMKYELIDDAEKVYNRILTIQPENQDVYRRMIALNRNRGTMEEAIEITKSLAGIQHKAEDTAAAIETLKEIFEFDAMNVDIHRRIIALHREIDQVDEAIEMYLALYDILQNTGTMEEATQALSEAIGLKPEDTQLRKKLITAYIQAGENEKAIAEYFQVCHIHTESKRYQEALNTLAEILEHDPGNIQAKKKRAETYALMGDEKKALAEFLKISSELDSSRIPVKPAVSVSQAEEPSIPELPIVEDYTFDSFVVGARNNFAYATALAVAKAPAQNYNPLFLSSDVGLGKTHLIHAIANHIRTHRPEMRILYTNSEEFTTQLIEAIQNNEMLQFRARNKNTDILLLDDVQFLANKERAQEEFFHLFNALFQAKKQIVITSDRPPKDIAHLEKRLKSRFGAGIVVDIQPPDMVTRAAILKKEREHYSDVEVSDQIINLIAEKVDTNIRDLKGAFNQIIARQRITNNPINEKMVMRVLDNLFEKV